METSYYQEHLSELVQSRAAVERREQKKKQEQRQKDFCFVSANLLNFLPHIPQDEHERIYLDICAMYKRLTLEPDRPELIETLLIEGDTGFLQEQQNLPAIFCTYHLGSYRALIGLLAKAGIDFVLASGGNMYQKQRDKITEYVRTFQQTAGKEAFFDVIDVTNANATLELTSQLLKGRSIVAYVDGNTGVGGVYQRDNSMLKLDFLGKPIYSRKGLSVLSFLTKRPLIPAISYYQSVDSSDETLATVRFYPPISPPASRDHRDQYFEEATTQLYRILEKNLRTYYDQWEGWIYVHKYLDFDYLKSIETSAPPTRRPADPHRWAFNKERYGLFKIDDDGYVFDKVKYASVKLSDSLFEGLCALVCDHPPLVPLDPSLLETLAARHILVTRSV